MLKYLKKYFPYLILFLFSWFFSHQLFKPGFLLYGEEQGYLNYDYVNYRDRFFWGFSRNFGSPSPNFFNLFTFGSLWSLFKIINLPLLLSEQLYFFIIFFLTSLFSFLLFEKISGKRLLALLLTLTYLTTYNYYATLITSPKLLHFCLLSFSLFFWWRYVIKPKPIYLIINLFLLIFTLSLATNPPQLISAYGFIFLTTLILSQNDLQRKRTLFFLVPYLLIIIFVAAITFLTTSNTGHLIALNLFQSRFEATDSRNFDIFRFFGAWWDYSEDSGLKYNHLFNHYHSWIGQIITYLPSMIFIALFFISSLFSKMKAKLVFIFLFFFFLTKGNTAPFANLFNYFYTFSFFKIYREPWAKFIPDLIFSVYLGIAALSQPLLAKKNSFLILILSVLLFFQFIPLAQGKIFSHQNISWQTTDVKIPQYWLDFQKWSEKNLSDKRVLVLPANIGQYDSRLAHLWPPYPYKGYPEEYFAYTNTLVYSYNYWNGFSEPEFIAYHFFNSLQPNLLSLYSVDYVLYKNDVAKEGDRILDLNLIETALDQNNKVSFGKLDLYPVKKNLATSAVRLLKKLDNIENSCSFDFVKDLKQPNTFGAIDNKNIDTNVEYSQDTLTVDKINPVLYRLRFSGSDDLPVALLLTSTFNRGWKIYSDSGFFAQPLSDQIVQMPANCFANLWLIKPEVVNRQPTLYLKYEPEMFFQLYLYLFSFSLAVYLLFICFFREKNFADKHNHD